MAGVPADITWFSIKVGISVTHIQTYRHTSTSHCSLFFSSSYKLDFFSARLWLEYDIIVLLLWFFQCICSNTDSFSYCVAFQCRSSSITSNGRLFHVSIFYWCDSMFPIPYGDMRHYFIYSWLYSFISI